MDFVATVLGLQLPTLKARDCLKRERGCGLILDNNDQKITWGCDRELWDFSKPGKSLDNDDDTVSTLSDSESSDSLSCCVSFATPLVTAVFIRPFTDRQEKEELFYNEHDYRKFRMEFRNSLRRRRSTVRFASNIVSHVQTLPVVENKHEVYYSSSELKQ